MRAVCAMYDMKDIGERAQNGPMPAGAKHIIQTISLITEWYGFEGAHETVQTKKRTTNTTTNGPHRHMILHFGWISDVDSTFLILGVP